jgi:hypothetical protein
MRGSAEEMKIAVATAAQGGPDQSGRTWIPAFAGMTVGGEVGSLVVNCRL